MQPTLSRLKAFTLLEVVIVVLITIVLSSIALPKLFSALDRSYTAEAYVSISSIRAAAERCQVLNNTQQFNNCITFNKLDIGDPSTTAGSHFQYSMETNPGGTELKVVAERVKEGGVLTGNAIECTYSETDNVCVGTGSYSYIKE